jgi:hypothetical protein
MGHRLSQIHIEIINVVPPAHGGILTGHIEFDVALLLFVLGMMTSSILFLDQPPRGVARRIVLSLIAVFVAAGIISAIIGFRSLVGI